MVSAGEMRRKRKEQCLGTTWFLSDYSVSDSTGRTQRRIVYRQARPMANVLGRTSVSSDTS